MKVFIVTHHAKSLLNFRGQLLSEFVEAGHDVTVCAPENPSEFFEKFSEMGISFITFPLVRNGMNPIKDLYALQFLTRIYPRKNPMLYFPRRRNP